MRGRAAILRRVVSIGKAWGVAWLGVVRGGMGVGRRRLAVHASRARGGGEALGFQLIIKIIEARGKGGRRPRRRTAGAEWTGGQGAVLRLRHVLGRWTRGGCGGARAAQQIGDLEAKPL